MPSSRIRYQTSREAYDDRNETLRLLGFKSYGAYLKSKLWKIVRERALELVGRTCKRCGHEAKQVHHAVYTREVLTGEDVRGLVPVCGWCHGKASLTGRGSQAKRIDGLRVRHLADTNAKLFRHRPRTRYKHPPNEKVYWCKCGRYRKKNHVKCGACRKAAGWKPRHKGLSIDEARALSARYAAGEFK